MAEKEEAPNPKRQKLEFKTSELEDKRSDILVASVQFTHVPDDKTSNLAVIENFIKRASQHEENGNKVKVIIFPEMCITGYWHVRKKSKEEITKIAEPVPNGPSTGILANFAKQYDMAIGAGLVENDNDVLYNTFVVVLPSGETFKHRKIHCFISEHMESGTKYTTFDAFGWRFGVLVCYDNNLIENVRLTALKGAEILLAPHQTGGCDSRSPDAMGLIDTKLWTGRDDPMIRAKLVDECQGEKGREWLMRWLPSRAHDNGMFYVFSNGIGIDDNEVRTGNAMIIDPYGKIISECKSVTNDIVYGTLKIDRIEMCTGQRWLRARRPELYSPLGVKLGTEMNPRNARFSRKRTRDKT